MKKFIDNLKTYAQENPIVTLIVGSAALTAATKALEANTKARNSRTYAKEIDRRVANKR